MPFGHNMSLWMAFHACGCLLHDVPFNKLMYLTSLVFIICKQGGICVLGAIRRWIVSRCSIVTLTRSYAAKRTVVASASFFGTRVQEVCLLRTYSMETNKKIIDLMLPIRARRSSFQTQSTWYKKYSVWSSMKKWIATYMCRDCPTQLWIKYAKVPHESRWFNVAFYWPSGIVVAYVRPSVHHQVCPRDNSSPIQARITKCGP